MCSGGVAGATPQSDDIRWGDAPGTRAVQRVRFSLPHRLPLQMVDRQMHSIGSDNFSDVERPLDSDGTD